MLSRVCILGYEAARVATGVLAMPTAVAADR